MPSGAVVVSYEYEALPDESQCCPRRGGGQSQLPTHVPPNSCAFTRCSSMRRTPKPPSVAVAATDAEASSTHLWGAVWLESDTPGGRSSSIDTCAPKMRMKGLRPG